MNDTLNDWPQKEALFRIAKLTVGHFPENELIGSKQPATSDNGYLFFKKQTFRHFIVKHIAKMTLLKRQTR